LLSKGNESRKRANILVRALDKVRAKADAGLQYVIHKQYRPFLDKVLKRKVLGLMTFVAVCIFIMSFALSGWLKFTFEANVLADFIQVNMQFPAGTSMPSRKMP
jgi:multidrug efflux pump subunit AcrB